MAAKRRETGDAELVRSALRGNTEAFDRLVERHFGMIFLIGYARLASREAAEDLAQEVFLSAYLSLSRLDSPRCFSAWLRQIAHNRAADWMRRDERRSRLLRMVPIHGCDEVLADERAKEAPEVVETNERQRAVHDAIVKLPADQRELVLLHYIEGLTKKEIAQRSAMHPSTVGRRIEEALTAMKEALEPVLRELAPAIKAPSGAAARTTALVAAVSLMSAVNRKALAETIAGAGKLAAGTIAPSEGTTSIGVLFSSLKALLTAAATKGATAASIKAAAAATVVAVVLAASSVLLLGQDDRKAQGAARETKALAFPLNMKTIPLFEDLTAARFLSDTGTDFPYLPALGSYNAGRRMPKPETIKNEPETLSLEPLYGTVAFGVGDHGSRASRKMDYRLDESTGPDGGYDRLILDANGNGDLSDDRVYLELMDLSVRKMDARSKRFTEEDIYFGLVDIPMDDQKAIWRPKVRATAFVNRLGVRNPGSPTIVAVSLANLCYLETTVHIGDLKARIWITDANFDLRWGVADGLTGNDRIVRDRDDSGKCSSFVSLRLTEPLSPVIYFGANPYRMTLAEDLSAMRLKAYNGPLGELAARNDVKGLRLAWKSEEGEWAPLTVRPENGVIKVPVGEYDLTSCLVAAKDEDGNTVGAMGQMQRETEPTVVSGGEMEVKPGEKVTLSHGPPLLVTVQAMKMSGSATRAGATLGPPRLDIDIKVTGAGGEVYPLWRIEKFDRGGVVSKILPRFRILDESNTEVARGKIDTGQVSPFHTGDKPSWVVPKKLVGKRVRIVPVLDLGPIQTVCEPLTLQL